MIKPLPPVYHTYSIKKNRQLPDPPEYSSYTTFKKTFIRFSETHNSTKLLLSSWLKIMFYLSSVFHWRWASVNACKWINDVWMYLQYCILKNAKRVVYGHQTLKNISNQKSVICRLALSAFIITKLVDLGLHLWKRVLLTACHFLVYLICIFFIGNVPRDWAENSCGSGILRTCFFSHFTYCKYLRSTLTWAHLNGPFKSNLQRWAPDIFFMVRYRWFNNFFPVIRLRPIEVFGNLQVR